MIAALFVRTDGPYAGRPDVDLWPEARDARLYAGPWPVVAHPPCQRWGRYWFGGPSCKVRKVKGDDGGCFKAALEAVRMYGGVLEHPEASAAWATFGLNAPPRGGGWVNADLLGGWTCCVEQGAYGHPGRKATWLYAVGVDLPTLTWRSEGTHRRLDEGFHSAEERRNARKAAIRGATERLSKRLSKRQRELTPPAFADLLIHLAHTANNRSKQP